MVRKILKNRKKILGRNEWGLEYVRKHNLSKAFTIADDKLLTKKMLNQYDIPTPDLLATLRTYEDVKQFDFYSLPKSFVIKPVKGLIGSGILIVYNKDKNNNWIKSDGSRVSNEELHSHCRDILDGKFSLYNEPDVVMIEERIKFHKAFRYHTYKGTPDLRVIVFNKMPVMAELRLPTKESGGRANMTIGAIGAGIDLAEGKTTTAVKGTAGNSGTIERFPETNQLISGLRIPYFEKILKYAIKASEITQLGFAGIDFLIDREKGPLVVEVNARSGLAIQLANMSGLKERLKKAEGIQVTSTEKAIRLAKDLFGGEIEQGIESLSGKKIIGIYENVTLKGEIEKAIKTKAKIDTGSEFTLIDKKTALKIGFQDILEDLIEEIPSKMLSEKAREKLANFLTEKYSSKYDFLREVKVTNSSSGKIRIRPLVKVEVTLGDTTFETRAVVSNKNQLQYSIIVGRNSLKRYLVDPNKNKISI